MRKFQSLLLRYTPKGVSYCYCMNSFFLIIIIIIIIHFYYSRSRHFFPGRFWENYNSYSSENFTHCSTNKDGVLKEVCWRWQLPPMDDNRSKFQINSLISPSIWLRFQILFLLKTQNSKLHIWTAIFNQTKSIAKKLLSVKVDLLFFTLKAEAYAAKVEWFCLP